MLTLNRILSELGINTEEFFYSDNVILYYKNEEKPFGQIVFKNGHYKLTVGDVEGGSGCKHVIK